MASDQSHHSARRHTTPSISPASPPTERPVAREGRLSVHEGYADHLRKLGVRVTPQRLFVLEALEFNSGHMTAEEIMQWASRHYPALNLATVYRTLDLLREVGLVAQTDLGGGAAYYELVGDSPHHHLCCERCGAVEEMDESLLETLREGALQRYGFHATPRHLAIFGVCQACWENNGQHGE